MQELYFALIFTTFLLGMLSHDRSVRRPPVNMDGIKVRYTAHTSADEWFGID